MSRCVPSVPIEATVLCWPCLASGHLVCHLCRHAYADTLRSGQAVDVPRPPGLGVLPPSDPDFPLGVLPPGVGGGHAFQMQTSHSRTQPNHLLYQTHTPSHALPALVSPGPGPRPRGTALGPESWHRSHSPVPTLTLSFLQKPR